MIRWVIEGKLGTAAGDDVGPDDRRLLIDTRTLVDKRGNTVQALLDKIREGTEELRRGGCVVVICDFGVSRSNTIAAGILACWRDLDVDTAVAQVVASTGEASIKLDMVESLREALPKQTRPTRADGILVTGGNGFIGVPLRDRLAETHRVVAPDSKSLDLLGPVVNLDRFCREHDIAKIVHLAYPRIYTNNEAMGQSLTMLRGILDVCKSRRIELVLPSSWVVFSGYRTRSLDADEYSAPRPRGVYGEAKFLEETLVRNAAANGEVIATIVRLSPIYGARSLRPRLIRFAHQYLLENRTIITHRYRNGLPSLQLLYVDDAVAGLASVVRHGRSPTYHLGGSTSYEPREIIASIGEVMGRRPNIEEARIEDDTANVFLDFSRTESELGWQPTVGLPEGLRHTLADALQSGPSE